MDALPQTTLRLLSDRSFEKRKAGAHEVELLCRRLRELNSKDAIRKLVVTLAEEFALSIQPNQRKGGLIGLASCAIGLGSSTVEYLPIIVGPVLRNFNDAEPRVRYYACESLFNITKICRGAILAYFADIFVGVCKLVADVDGDVKNGAALYDRLLKEVVMEGESLDVRRFVPLLRAHMGVMNPYVRQLLVGWLTALDSVPGVDMLDHVPDLLGGLFDMLSDGNREIRQQAYGALSDILDQMIKVPRAEVPSRIRFAPMVAVLIAQTARDRDKFNRVTAVEWLTQFMLLGGTQLAGVYSPLAAAVLKCLSDPEPEIAGEAAKANSELMMLVRATPPTSAGAGTAAAAAGGAAAAAVPTPSGGGISFDAAPLVAVVTAEVRSKDKATRSAALRWVTLLLSIAPVDVMADVDAVLDALLSNLGDTTDADTLKLDLEVLARLCCVNVAPPSSALSGAALLPQGSAGSGSSSGSNSDPLGGYAAHLRHRMLGDLMRAFGSDRALLETKGAFILRRLCMLLDARLVYGSLARILLSEPNREFAALVVELLNLILLTAVETADLRELIRGCGGGGGGGALQLLTPASASSAAPVLAPPSAVAAATSARTTGVAGVSTPATSPLASASPSPTAAAATATVAAVVAPPSQPSQLLLPALPALGSEMEGDAASVFHLLYRTWVVNPTATFSLCLLAQAYDLCARIMAAFAERTITVGVLMQCDKLVQLLESPIFLCTRMHLTQPQRGDHGALLRALYGLLMVLPQGTAFCTLRDRLACVSPLAAAASFVSAASASGPGVASAAPGACGTASLGGLPLDSDGLFAVFEASQLAQWYSVTADVRARSILRRRGGHGAAPSTGSVISPPGAASAASALTAPVGAAATTAVPPAAVAAVADG